MLAATLVVAAALGGAAPAAAPLPGQIRAEYEITSLGITVARVHETFVRTGDDYRIESVTTAEGPLKLILDDRVTLESSGRYGPAGLQPLRFEQRRVKAPKKDILATFDWERGVLVSRYQGERKEIALPRATQDRISLMYQFMKAQPRDGPMTIPMSNGRRVEVYTYRFVAEERIATPAGEFDTLHFERVTAGPKENKADVWLAKAHHNFPVRIEFDSHKGISLVQSLVSIEAR